VRKRLNNNGGFTLAEVLIAMAILLLMTALVAVGIPMAARVYTKAVDSANAQVLLSTTVTELRYHLHCAENIEINENGINYDDSKYGEMRIEMKTGAANSGETTDENNGNGGDPANGAEGDGTTRIFLSYRNLPDLSRPLVSDAAATSHLHIKYDTVTFSDGLIKFENLKVYNTSGSVLAELPELIISEQE